MPRIRCALVATALLVIAAVPARAVDPGDLLKFSPIQTNAAVVINSEGILASPRAIKEGWAKIDRTEILAGAIPINPHLERVVVVKEIHPRAPAGGPTFALAVSKRPVDVDKLAKASGGRAITIGDEPAVLTPHQSFLVPLEAQLFGVAWTDNRQDVGRWLRSAKTAKASPLALYVNGVVRTLGSLHHVVIGLDTECLFDPEHTSTVVAMSKALAADKEGAEGVRKFLAGMRGVSLTVDFTTDGLAAVVRFDSTARIVKVKPEAFKLFVLECLARNGAMLEDLPAAKAEARDGTVTLRFKLSDPELAQIAALFLPPLPNLASDAIAVAPAGATAAATKVYVQTVNRILDDLKKQTKRASDYEKTAIWYDAAANRIETVSLLNADKTAVEYAQGTAGRLRAIGDSLRGVPIEVNMLNSKIYSVTSYQGGLYQTGRRRFGLSAVPTTQTNAASIWQQEADAVERDRQSRAKLWEAMDLQRSAIRNELIIKYKFDVEATKK